MKRLLVVTCLVASSAFAQTDREPDRVVYPRNTNITFSETEVGGGRTRPADTLIYVKRPTLFPNLIKIRGSFAPELQASVDKL